MKDPYAQFDKKNDLQGYLAILDAFIKNPLDGPATQVFGAFIIRRFRNRCCVVESIAGAPYYPFLSYDFGQHQFHRIYWGVLPRFLEGDKFVKFCDERGVKTKEVAEMKEWQRQQQLNELLRSKFSGTKDTGSKIG